MQEGLCVQQGNSFMKTQYFKCRMWMTQNSLWRGQQPNNALMLAMLGNQSIEPLQAFIEVPNCFLII